MSLPIRALTLYKHGIAVVERGGAATGEAVTLRFHRDGMNDVLKSLVAWDRAGGQVRTIAYEAPEERDAKLERGSIHLSDESALADLLRDLRGRSVRVRVAQGEAGAEEVAGTVIGLDVGGGLPFTVGRLSLLTESGVRVLRLRDLVGVALLDATAREDLAYVLRLSTAEAEQRTVTLRLSDGEHDLVVRYLAPSPTWRVSYRFVGETEAGGERRALLQGWGIFDNPFDEPLEGIRISLVAGMPISFIYDLYSPFTPQRPEVKEEARVAAAPVELERAKLSSSARPAPAPMAMRARALSMPAMEEAEAADEALLFRQSVGAGTEIAAQGEAQGERFEYRIGPPVTVQRGEAAMVPILSAELPYRREHLYNGQKMPKHPTVVLRFQNASELTLERGPVTVVEDDRYAGEAIFPFTRPDAEVLLAVAVDLGVSVREERQHVRETHRLALEGELLVFHEFLTLTTRYEISNSNGEPLDLLIEQPRTHGFAPFDMPPPDERTDGAYRWRLAVPAGPLGEATFEVRERQSVQRHEQLGSLSHEALARYLRQGWLDQALASHLGGLLDLYAEKQRLAQRIHQVDQERARLMGTQEQARKNMGGLKESGEEGQLRARYVRQLNESEDALAHLEGERQEHQRADAALDQRLRAALATLG